MGCHFLLQLKSLLELKTPYTVWHLLTSSHSKQSSHLPMESLHPVPSPLRVCAMAWNALLPNDSTAGTCPSFSWESAHPGETFWQHRIKHCLLPALIRQITFFYCFQIMKYNQRVYFSFVQLYLCISRASPIRMSTPWQQEIWLSCSLLHVKHSPWHNIRILAERIELWRMNGWICKWVCKLRAKKTSSGRKYVLTVTCRRVSQHF